MTEQHYRSIASNYQLVSVASNRVFVVMFSFIVVFAVIILRLFDVAVLQASKYSSGIIPYNNEVIRAKILDRNGEVLAVNLKTFSLYVNPKFILHPAQDAEKLVDVLPSLDYESILNKFLDPEKSFFWIKRRITPLEKYKINSLGIPGLFFHTNKSRFYPKGSLFSNIIGYTGIDGIGLAGAERFFEQNLQEDISLSLDSRVQYIVYSELEKVVKKFEANFAMGIVMDVNNGEILSMVNFPSYNPKRLHEATEAELFNNVTLGLYEVGSAVKTFTVATGLDRNIITLDQQYDVSKPIRIKKYTIRDYHRYEGKLSVRDIYKESSNIGTAKIAMEIGADLQRYYYNRLGLFKPLKLEIFEKSTPNTPRKWDQVANITRSYGHGMAITPVHLIQAIACLVSDGRLKYATIVKGKRYTESKPIVKQSTVAKIREIMRETVTDGTGKQAYLDGYDVGGKTGSAEKVIDGKYSKKLLLSSFVGAFPMYNPRYIVLVMVDEPKGIKETYGYATGGWVAAPVVGKIIKRTAQFLSVPVTRN